MVRVDAQRLHAQMVDRVAVRDRANMGLVGVAMGVDLLPLSTDLDGEDSVPTLRHGASPEPASLGAFKLGSESNNRVLSSRSAVASLHTADHTTVYTEHIGRQLIERLGRIEEAA